MLQQWCRPAVSGRLRPLQESPNVARACEHVSVLSQSISLPDWDFNSTCYLFTECLAEIQAWSQVGSA